MIKFNDYIKCEITKDNAKEIYMELGGEFSYFLSIEQYDKRDFYDAVNNSDDDCDLINNVFDNYYSYIDFECKLMDSYRDLDNKYNLLGKFKRLGFANEDFLKWNMDLINKEIDSYYEKNLNIDVKDMPYYYKFYDTKITNLLKATKIFTADYQTNKRLVDMIKDYLTLGDGIIYKCYNYWIHSGVPSKDDVHPFYSVDEYLIGRTHNDLIYINSCKSNPSTIDFYYENIVIDGLKTRLEKLGFSDLLEEYDRIMTLRKEYIGHITFEYAIDSNSMDILDMYRNVFDKTNIYCPYYSLKSYEMEELLNLSSNTRNYFIDYDNKPIGTITFETGCIDGGNREKYIRIKCICILKEYQNNGFGKKAMDFIFNSFTNVSCVYLDILSGDDRLKHFFMDICQMQVCVESECDGQKVYTLVKNTKN